MERKTIIDAAEGRCDLSITRAFDLPLNLLYRAYTEAEFVAEWMGTKVLQLDRHSMGGYRFETSDSQGNVLFKAHGTLHEVLPEQRIVRTFEMEGAGLGAQLEFLEFEALDEDRSQLRIHTLYRTAALRDRQLSMPFAYGINMAHDRLEKIMLNKL